MEKTYKFRKSFKNKHVVLPVIHLDADDRTAWQLASLNARIAMDSGADGVFLIDHNGSVEDVKNAYKHIKQKHPDLWIGANFLGIEHLAPIVPSGLDGIWTDDLDGTTVDGLEPLIFGGVAFKYQKSVMDVAMAASSAKFSHRCDVITTSGMATGYAPKREKIETMKNAIGDFPLAIASGITPENVVNYLDCADCFLAATGISKSFTELDPVRTKALVDRVRG